MPFNGAGVYSPPSPPTYPAVTGELIRAADYNATISDLAAALTNCVTKDNQSTVPMLTLGALAVTGVAALGAGATVAGDAILTRRYSTGEVVLSVSPTAPAGTLALDGSTIGSAASGATGRAHADTQALYELLWNNSNNTLLPIQDATGAATTRGLTAAADFAANKRLPLPTPEDGDALLVSVSSAVLTRSVGEVLSHTHTVTVGPDGTHAHEVPVSSGAGGLQRVVGQPGQAPGFISTSTDGAHSHSGTAAAAGGAKNKAAGFFLKPYIAL